MEMVLLFILIVLSVGSIVLIFITRKSVPTGHHDQALRVKFCIVREEAAKASRELREEMSMVQKTYSETLVNTIREMGRSQIENRGTGCQADQGINRVE